MSPWICQHFLEEPLAGERNSVDLAGLDEGPGGAGAGEARERGVPQELEQLRVEATHVDRGEVVHAEAGGLGDQEILLGHNLRIIIEKYIYWKGRLDLILVVVLDVLAIDSTKDLTDGIRNILFFSLFSLFTIARSKLYGLRVSFKSRGCFVLPVYSLFKRIVDMVYTSLCG